MSSFEYNQYLAKNLRQLPRGSEGSTEKESDLHAQIIEFCKQKGWLAFYGSMAHSTYRTPGEPDFQIAADNGRFFMVECKTRTGKLSADQLAIQAWAKKLGHQVHVVRSMSEFMEAVK